MPSAIPVNRKDLDVLIKLGAEQTYQRFKRVYKFSNVKKKLNIYGRSAHAPDDNIHSLLL